MCFLSALICYYCCLLRFILFVGNSVSMLLVNLFCFFKARDTKNPEDVLEEQSDQMSIVGFVSASFCPENKCCLCPLEAADLSWTHRQLFSLICFHTKHFLSSLHLILSLRCTALPFRSHLSPYKQHTHTTQLNLHTIPEGPVEGMLAM